MGFLKKHIEKILFVVLFLGLAITLMTLMNFRSRRETSDSVRFVAPQQELSMDFSKLDGLKALLTTSPHQVASSVEGFTPAERVICMNPNDRALIPVGATICPYCGWKQEEIERDSSGDGIPDHLKLRWGLNPNDATDVFQSIDGTGFSVLVQFQRGHDPMDPSDYPPHIDFLRVQDIDEQLIRFEFRGFTQITEDIFMVQLRYRYPDQNDWQPVRVRAGEDPTGQGRNRFGRNNEFTADRFVQTGERIDDRFVDQSYVMISGGRTPFMLYRDGERASHSVIQRTATLHLYMGPEWSETVQPDDTFALDNKTYKVVDIHAETVVIADTDTETRQNIRSASVTELEAAEPPQDQQPEGLDDDEFIMDPSMFFSN